MEDEIEKKLAELRGISLDEKKLRFDQEQQMKQVELKLLGDITEAKQNIVTHLSSHNLPSAKKEYKRMKRLFEHFPRSAEKQKLFREIIDVYNQIRFIEGKQPMKQEEADRIKEVTAERLTDIIEASLDTNVEFEAIAVFTEAVECVVGVVQQNANPEIIKLIERTLHKINLEQYMSRLGKVSIGGEGHIQIGAYDIFFERVSPDHLSTVICNSIKEDTIKNITQLNKYLNQALSVTPEGVSEETFKRADLMTELKMRLQNRGKSIDELL